MLVYYYYIALLIKLKAKVLYSVEVKHIANIFLLTFMYMLGCPLILLPTLV